MRRRFTFHGFTLLEMMVVMAIIALLLTIVTPKYFSHVDRAKEAVLRQNIASMRDAIDKFYSDTGKYPASLDVLVEQHYLRTIPVDPITEKSDTWILQSPIDPSFGGGVFDVHSGADGNGADGTAYNAL